ncbi:hypothetical protein EVAR_18631_1 [Eumeta japonica]|uniref:Uncharacterized protein n=1 Tax=Eumeta variegata TaxID=151549 RepID=A0A4C1U6V6_EUMVA|nr:hypothetical protein EVAR_18631_1 [Eumeta japonica]
MCNALRLIGAAQRSLGKKSRRFTQKLSKRISNSVYPKAGALRVQGPRLYGPKDARSVPKGRDLVCPKVQPLCAKGLYIA